MNVQEAQVLAQLLVRGELTTEQFVERVSRHAVADVGVAQLDLDRRRRCGFPEVVFGQGKSVEALQRILKTLVDEGIDALATRIPADTAAILLDTFPAGRYNALARMFRIPATQQPAREPESADEFASVPMPGRVTVVTAGTSDLPVAEEAKETAAWMGAEVTLVQDVGVAGPHRLPMHLDKLTNADAVIVVAGMEGALPSVVGGWLACPVIAVPTSVGYGANLGGFAALLSMLNSCAANVTVVNIDAGFKGGYIAGLIARRISEARSGRS